MLELIRKYIINKRTMVSVKKRLLKKSNYNNDELLYSIKSFGTKNKNKIFYVINRTAGGGMFFAHSMIEVDDSTISNGSGTGFGGGIYLYDSEIAMNTTSISGNEAMYGGGMVLGSDYSYYYSLTEFTDVTVSNNNASVWGGGIYYTSGMHFLTDREQQWRAKRRWGSCW